MSHPRVSLIENFLQQVQEITQAGVDRQVLAQIQALLTELSLQHEFFNFEQFPAPTAEEGKSAHRYRLNNHGDNSPTLYLNALLPSKTTLPHNHETWAVIVAVQGQELNSIYARQDDGANPSFADLSVAQQVVVEPGQSIGFLGDDIHSISVLGQQPILHFHLYGRPLEALDGRFGVRADGQVVGYNKSQMEPSVEAYGL